MVRYCEVGIHLDLLYIYTYIYVCAEGNRDVVSEVREKGGIAGAMDGELMEKGVNIRWLHNRLSRCKFSRGWSLAAQVVST